MICSVLKEGTVTHKTCKKCCQKFWNDDFCLTDEEHLGAPKKFDDRELEQLLIAKPAQTQDELALPLGVIRQSVFVCLHNLGNSKTRPMDSAQAQPEEAGSRGSLIRR